MSPELSRPPLTLPLLSGNRPSACPSGGVCVTDGVPEPGAVPVGDALPVPPLSVPKLFVPPDSVVRCGLEPPDPLVDDAPPDGVAPEVVPSRGVSRVRPVATL